MLEWLGELTQVEEKVKSLRGKYQNISSTLAAPVKGQVEGARGGCWKEELTFKFQRKKIKAKIRPSEIKLLKNENSH